MSGVSGLRIHDHSSPGQGGSISGGTGSSDALLELLGTNDSEFTSTIGNWVAGGTGATVARETSTKMTGQTASLKVHTTTTATYAEVPITGTFEAGKTYYAVVVIWREGLNTIELGVPGTDSATYLPAIDRHGAVTPVTWRAYAVRWEPTADRSSGVKLRIKTGLGSTYDWYIGMAKLYDTPVLPLIPVNSSTGVLIPDSGTAHRLSMDADKGGLYQDGSGAVKLMDLDEAGGMNITPFGQMYLSETHTPSDLAEQGVNIEVGDDLVGLWISEKDASTIQIYDDGTGSYDIELVDQDASVGWQSVSSGGVHKKLVTMESRKGSGTTATITSGNTSVTVTHGAGYTPAAEDIMVTPTNNPTNDPGNFWIDTIGGTTFAINVRANPGVSGATFAWRVDR